MNKEQIIEEIKKMLDGKSYSEISDILITTQCELMQKSIYQNPV